MDFRTALAHNLPPRRLGPVRLSYADSCLLLDVAARGRADALSQGLAAGALASGLGALGLLVQPDGTPLGAATGLVLVAAGCVAGATRLERAPGYHRWALLFATEELVLERHGSWPRRARAERMHFDQVRGLALEADPRAPRQRRLVLHYEDAEGTACTAVLLRHVGPGDGPWATELVSRLEQVFGLTAAAARPSRPPPSQTLSPGGPPARG